MYSRTAPDPASYEDQVGGQSQCLSQTSPQASTAVIGAERLTIAAREEQGAVVDGVILICAQHAQHGLCCWDRATVRSVLLSRKAIGRGLAALVTQLVATRLASVDALPALRDLTVTAAMEEQFGEGRPPLLVRDLDPLAGLSALTRLCLKHTLVDDIRVLAGLPALRMLSLARNPGVSDLTPLSALRLEHLDLTATGVADITPLAHMSSLEVLRLDRCTELRRLMPHLPRLRVLSLAYAERVSDLTGVPGPALEELDLSHTGVKDITPLSALSNLRVLSLEQPGVIHSLNFNLTDINHVTMLSRLTRLRVLNLKGIQVSDLTPLQQLELEELVVPCDAFAFDARDLAPLGAMHSLRRLDTSRCAQLLNASVLSRLTRLESLTTSCNDALQALAGTAAALTRLVLYRVEPDVSPCAHLPSLQELVLRWSLSPVATHITFLASLTCLRRLCIRCDISFDDTGVSDLSPLRGLRLDHLQCYSRHLTDLSPLAAMASLTDLNFDGCDHLVDITPLAHLSRLRCLYLPRCPVTDIGALAQLPLQQLSLHKTRVRDLSPLSTVHTLVSLDVTSTPAQDLSPLAGLMGLKLLATQDCMAVGEPSTALVSLRGYAGEISMRLPRLDLSMSDGLAYYSWINGSHGWVDRRLIAGCHLTSAT